MDEKIIEENKQKEEKDSVCIKDFYKDKEISKFLNHILNINIQRILSDLNKYIECGDWKNCLILIDKIIEHKIFKYAKEEYKKNLLDIIIKKLLPNIYIYQQSDVEEIFELIYYNTKYLTDYKIDWKFFYTLFYITSSSKSLTDNKAKLYLNLKKFYSKDSITFEDYKILKKTFFSDLVYSNFHRAFCDFIYFLPTKYILEDDELQLRLLYFMQNQKLYFVDCCCLFHKILRKEGYLFFSKDPKQNDEYIKTFINYYFTLLNLFISGDGSVINSNY